MSANNREQGCANPEAACANAMNTRPEAQEAGISELLALSADPVTMFAMADAFTKAHDEHAALRIAKIYAAGQRQQANVIVGLRAALEVLESRTNVSTLATPARVVSDEMVERALRAFYEISTPIGIEVFGEWGKTFPLMRAAIKAALSLPTGDAGEGERIRWFKRAGDYLIRAQRAEALLARCRALLQESQDLEGRHSEMKAMVAEIDTALHPGQEKEK